MWTAVGRIRIFLVALVLAAIPLTGARAQANAPPEPPPSPADAARAAALRAQAMALFTDRSHHHEAAELLQQASALTPVADPARVDDLRLAANLLFFAGATADAQGVMVEAAEAALARGDVMVAANSLVDAGWIANERHGAADARELAFRALHLASSPLLTPDQREAIRSRIVFVRLGRGANLSGQVNARRTGWSVASERTQPARRSAP